VPHIAGGPQTLDRRPRLARAAALLVLAMGAGAGSALAQSIQTIPANSLNLTYVPLTYQGNTIIPTGIRDNTVTGTYVLPGGVTAGLLYSTATQTGTPFPVNAPSNANFPVPGTLANTPYGPSFGSYGGILRAVGSYQTTASSPYDIGYLYDGAALGGNNVITLQYPGSPFVSTLFTIPHSTFGNQVVGNYDTSLPGGLLVGNAFIYNIPTATYTQNNYPGAVSTTAYGIWGNLISGGYAGPLDGTGITHGYIYNETTGVWTTYNYPGASSTHFEGIAGGGTAGTYNLVTDYTCVTVSSSCSSVGEHAAVLHIDAAGNQTWYNIDVPGALVATSANSAYQGDVIGIYVGVNGVTGYSVAVPGLYTPFFTNTGTLTTSTANTPAVVAAPGDDVLNNGTITTTGVGSAGVSADTYGVVTNNGTIAVSGAGSSAVLMNGMFGTLLNTGTLSAAPGAYALSTGPTAFGSLVVNYGTIDGQVNVTAGPFARFENDGWMGISAPGSGTTHLITGTFAQTATGTLSLRLGADGSHDALQVIGSAQVAGTLALALQPGLYATTTVYPNVVAATNTLQGSFSALTTTPTSPFLQSSILTSGNSITATVTRTPFDAIPGLTPNERAFGAGLESAYSSAASLSPTAQNFYTNLLFNPSATQFSLTAVPRTYDGLSGEGTSGTQNTAFLASSLFIQALTNRMSAWVADDSALTAGQTASAAASTVSDAAKPLATPGWYSWASGIVGSQSLTGNSGAGTADLGNRVGGGAAGIDYQLDPDRLIGVGVAGSSSSFSVNDRATSGQLIGGHIGFYGVQRWGTSYASATLGYSGLNNSVSRTAAVFGATESETGQFFSNQLGGRVEAGNAWTFDPVRVTPFGAIQFAELWQQHYSESGIAAGGGPGILSLTYAPISATSVPTSLGVQLDARIAFDNGMAWMPYARAAWVHEFSTTRQITASLSAIPGSTFTVDGASAGRDAAKIDLGSRLVLSPTAALFGSFNSEFSNAGRSYAGTAGLTISF
jgi:uncharacterized protein with beta-barrel porin domain